MSDDFYKKVVANDMKSAGGERKNQIKAQRSGFDLERRSDGMNERRLL